MGNSPGKTLSDSIPSFLECKPLYQSHGSGNLGYRKKATAPPVYQGEGMSSLEELFLSLLAIPSPSGKERRIADFVAAYASDLGCTVKEETDDPILGDTGNHVISLPSMGNSSKAQYVLVAHLDTVPVRFEPEIPLVRGRGPDPYGRGLSAGSG